MAEVGPDLAKLAEVGARTLEIKSTVSKDAVVEAAAKRMSSGDGGKALEIVAGEVIPHHKDAVNKGLLQNLSSERDEKTQEKKEPTKIDEARRLYKSREAAESIRSLVEDGKISPDLRKAVEAFVRNNSSTEFLKNLLEEAKKDGAVGKTVAIRVVSEKIVASDKFKEICARFYTERLDPKKRFESENDVRRLTSEVAQLEVQLVESVVRADIERAQEAVNKARSELLKEAAKEEELKSKSQELEELTEDLPAAKEIIRRLKLNYNVEQLTSDLRLKQAAIDSLDQSSPNYQQENTRIQSEIDAINKNPNYQRYIQSKSILDRQRELFTEIATLRQDLEPLIQEVKDAEAKLDELKQKETQSLTEPQRAKLQLEINEKKIALADAKAIHEAEISDYCRAITNIPQDAATELMQGLFDRAKTIWDEETVKIETLEDEVLSGALEKLPNLYKRSRRDKKTRLKYWITDKYLAQSWVEEYMEGGVEGLSAKLMAEIMSGGKLDKAGLRLRGLSKAEIDVLEKRLATKESRDLFMRENGNRLGVSAFADYLQAGGKMNEKLVKSIIMTQTGKDFLNQVAAKVGQSDEVKGIIDTLNQTSEAAKKKGWEFFRRNWWKIGLLIAALLVFLGIKAGAL